MWTPQNMLKPILQRGAEDRSREGRSGRGGLPRPRGGEAARAAQVPRPPLEPPVRGSAQAPLARPGPARGNTRAHTMNSEEAANPAGRRARTM